MLRVLREQWIRAKYERKEFSEPGKNFTYEEGKRTYIKSHIRYAFMKNSFIFIGDLCWFSVGIRDGMLMKRGRDNGQFLSRRFVLSEREGTLKYFTKYDVSIIFSVLFTVNLHLRTECRTELRDKRMIESVTNSSESV